MISRRLLRIKVIKALYAHLKSESDSLAGSEKTLVASIDKTYDLYFHMLSLIVELAHYAEQRQELAKQKKLPTYEDLNPNRKFVDNKDCKRSVLPKRCRNNLCIRVDQTQSNHPS